MTAHDLADLLDVGRPATADDAGNFLEVPWAKQAGTDHGQETSSVLASVVEAMDYATPNEQRLVRAEINLLAAHREGGDAFEAEDGLVEVVMAVRRGHPGLCWCEALEDGDAPTGLIRVNMEDDAKSTHLNRLSERPWHARKPPFELEHCPASITHENRKKARNQRHIRRL